eukprot:sb/3470275/
MYVFQTFINYSVKLFIEDALCIWGNEPFEVLCRKGPTAPRTPCGDSAQLAQVVEHETVDIGVAGSSPGFKSGLLIPCGDRGSGGHFQIISSLPRLGRRNLLTASLPSLILVLVLLLPFRKRPKTSKQPIRTRYLGHVTANQGPVFPDSVGSCYLWIARWWPRGIWITKNFFGRHFTRKLDRIKIGRLFISRITVSKFSFLLPAVKMERR